MSRKIFALFSVLLILAMLAACTPAAPAANNSAAAPKKVALIIAQGGLGDKSYNDLAYSGFQRAIKDFGIEGKAIESQDPVGEAEQLLRTAAKNGYDLVITLEYSHMDALSRVAPDFPKTMFSIVNVPVDKPNVVSVLFKEQEGSFLAGALAAMVTTMPDNAKVNPDKVIGCIGGTQSAGIDKFLVGYEEGAHFIDKDVKVLKSYSESFGDPAKGKELTLAMYEQKADIVYQVAGGTGGGVFQAAEDTKHYAIGVDSDQDGLKPGFILTSMMKRTDNAIYDEIGKLVKGELKGGTVLEYGLKENGVGLSPMTYTAKEIPADFQSKIKELQDKIVSGAIKVTDVTKQ